VLAGVATLSKPPTQHTEQIRNIVLENNAGTLVALFFARGNATHSDNLRSFLLTLLTPETLSKRRRQSSIKI
jgi:hypothetical protein